MPSKKATHKVWTKGQFKELWARSVCMGLLTVDDLRSCKTRDLSNQELNALEEAARLAQELPFSVRVRIWGLHPKKNEWSPLATTCRG